MAFLLFSLMLLSPAMSVAGASKPKPYHERRQNSLNDTNPFASIVPSESLEWHPCYENSTANTLGPTSCARLIAPLDYTNKSLGTVELAIFKLGGSNQNQTLNAVFYNPGGPGDDPVQKVLDTAPLLREQTGAGFDIIAIAPRGVGSTLPAMTCDSTDLIASRRLWEVQDTLPGFPSNSAAENYAIGQSLGLDCASISPDLVSYTSTVHVARDMDFVRQALGQDKLLYIGQSYGTVLGGTYAALYPDRVGRMVLDGVLDFNDWYSPYKDPRLDIGDADLALNNFFQMCHTAGPDACAIWSNKTEEIRSRFLEADRRILTEPLAVTNRGVLKWAAWRTGVYSALYRPSEGFPLLAGVISEILAGSAGPHIEGYLDIVQAAATNTQTNLVDPKTGLRNGPNVDPLISCTDGGVDTFNTNTNKFTATLARYEAVSEFFGGISSQAIFMCAGARLRTNARYTDRFQNMTTANPILFIGNVADPTTPILGAQHMSSAFLGSRLLTINGTGHISFNAAQTPECANGWMAQYFQNGTLPPVGTVYQGKQTPFNPSG